MNGFNSGVAGPNGFNSGVDGFNSGVDGFRSGVHGLLIGVNGLSAGGCGAANPWGEWFFCRGAVPQTTPKVENSP